MKQILFIIAIVVVAFASSCSKDSSATPNVPANLTGKLWVLDTIIINAPLTFDELTDQQKFDYTVSLGWTKDKAQITFNKDASVTCGGDWDFGYTQWQLQNSDNDLRMTQGSIGYDTLRSWQASSTQFSYIHTVSTESFDCTFIYK